MVRVVVPRNHTARSDLPTRGAAVGVLARAKGAPLMPWQQAAADVGLEFEPETGLPRYGIVLVTVPRQAGKTKLVGDVADERCLSKRRARVWITMQDGKTADEWMREEHHESLASAPAFRGRYTKSLRAGSVGVKWPALGSTFLTFPPTRNGLHSKQSDLVFDDEAWARTAAQGRDLRQAVRPTMATRPGAQLWVVSTQGDDSSEHLAAYMEMGLASLSDPDTRVCIVDYGIPDDADPEDLSVIAAHHPALGHTISLQSLQDARAEFASDPDGWARAYGNRATRARRSAIPSASWSIAARPRPEVPSRVGLGVDVSPAGDYYAVCAAWRDDAGEAWVEVLESGPVRRDVPAVVHALALARSEGYGLERASIGAVELADAIGKLSPPTPPTYLDSTRYAAACAALHRGIVQDKLHHSNQPALDAAVTNAARRDFGDGGFIWTRKHSTGNITELVAASVALQQWDTLPAPAPAPFAMFARA